MNATTAARWLWGSERAARVARLPLVPVSVAYDAAMRVRAAAYRRGWLASEHLPLPTVAVGNLAIGGAGKTPLAAWIAARYAAAGITPGLLLRGYGGDEPLVHRRLVPEAVVVADRDRVSGAQRAGLGGARVLVLDDAFQHLGVRRDLNILVVSAESAGASPWTLPAGPWRESWGALERADWVVVTRRHASIESARGLADRIASRRAGVPVSLAHLALTGFEGLASGQERPLGVIAGRQVVAAAGVADPATFAAQLGALGAGVQLVAYADHHAYSSADVGALLRSAARADYVVVTEKDAVKLRGQWPRDASEPLVARMQVSWEHNQASLERALDAVSARAPLPQLPR